MQRIIQTALCLAALGFSMMAADLKITFNTETKTNNAKKGTQGTMVHYYSSHYHLTRDEKGKQDTLLDYSDFAIYEIDHKKKVITKTSLDDYLETLELLSANLSDMSADDKVQMLDMHGRVFGGKKEQQKKEQKEERELSEEDVASLNRTLGKVSVKGRVLQVRKKSAEEIAEMKAEEAQMKAQQARAQARVADMLEMTFGGKNDGLSVEPLGTQVVAGRNCTGVKITSGSMVTSIIADPGLMVPIPENIYYQGNKLKDANAILHPGGESLRRISEEASKIKGVHLKTDTSMKMGPLTIKTTTEATSVETGPIPASVFDLPMGYKMEDAGRKMLEETRKKMTGSF